MRYLIAVAALGALSVASNGADSDEPGTTAFARLGPIVIHGNEADNLLLGAGAFDLRDETSPAGTIEYRFGRKLFVVGLSVGLVGNTRGGLYGYAGAYADLSYGKFYFTPQLAMGGYREGNSSDLGGVFQFTNRSISPTGSTMATASACARRTSPTPTSTTTIPARRRSS
jgi:hypothetical protein